MVVSAVRTIAEASAGLVAKQMSLIRIKADDVPKCCPVLLLDSIHCKGFVGVFPLLLDHRVTCNDCR